MLTIHRRRRITLTPMIAFAALALVLTVPVLSQTSLHAASVERYTTMHVRAGQTLWTIASANTSSDGDVQTTVDRIVTANHLGAAPIVPGERLLIPQ